MKHLPVETFIAGFGEFHVLLKDYPGLRMVPIEHAETVRNGLHRLGYQFRIRYRGPHGRQRDTHKADARAFTVYIQEELV
jgi:hypothetical protein